MIKFTCYHCTHCCFFTTPEEYPILLESEVKKLRELYKKRGKELVIVKIAEGIYRWVIKGFCPFYDLKRRRCGIYEYRPMACRMFPLILNPKTGEVGVSTACDWVVENLETILSNDPTEVFKEEFKAVTTIFKELTLSSGWRDP